MLNIRLPTELELKLAEEAKLACKSRSELTREALALYLRVRQRRRYLARLRQAAVALDKIEAQMLVDESLPLDNEAFELSEKLADHNFEGRWWK